MPFQMEITSTSFDSVRRNAIYITISVANACVYTGFICSKIIQWQNKLLQRSIFEYFYLQKAQDLILIKWNKYIVKLVNELFCMEITFQMSQKKGKNIKWQNSFMSMNIVRTPRLLIRVRHFRVIDSRVYNILCDINTHAYQKRYVRY